VQEYVDAFTRKIDCFAIAQAWCHEELARIKEIGAYEYVDRSTADQGHE